MIKHWMITKGAFCHTSFSFQVVIGMMASLITLPPALLLIFIFRKSRVRKLRPSRVDEALKEKKPPAQDQLQAGAVVQARDETLNVDSGHGKKIAAVRFTSLKFYKCKSFP